MRFSSVALGLAQRQITTLFKNPSLFLPPMLFPLMNFIAFAGGLSQLQHVEGFDYAGGYTGFQFVFVLLQSAAFGGVFTGFGIAADFEKGFARRLLLGAPNRLAILAGYAVAALVRAALVSSLLTVVALVSGMQVGGDGVDLPALAALTALVSLTATFFAAGVAFRMRTIQAGPAMQMPVFVVLFLAPVYVPLDLLSGWVEGAARINPFTPLVESGRDLIAGQDVAWLLAYGIAVALVAAFAVWAVRGLRRAGAAG